MAVISEKLSVIGKMEKELEIQTPAEKLYKIFKSQCFRIPNMTRKFHTAVEVLEGDWEKTGSVRQWKYNVDGSDQIFKEKVEVDEENKAVTFTAVGGHVLDHFKNYKGTFRFISNGVAGDQQGGNLVIITLDYEKRNLDDYDPIGKFMDLAVGIIKDIDAHNLL